MSLEKLNTELNDRTLRFDGVSIVKPAQIPKLLMAGLQPVQLRVSEIDEDVQLFNRMATEIQQLKLDSVEAIQFRREYELPESYMKLDVDEKLYEFFAQKINEYTPELQIEAADRLLVELAAFKKNGLYDLLRCLIFVLDSFKAKNVVYGVGRGSSCASFVLYLIGLHMVDPIKFKIPLEEFIRE